MSRSVLAALAGLLAAVSTMSGQAPLASTRTVVRFEPSSASAEAKAEFEKAYFHWENSFAARASQHLDRALQLDPEFGYARIVRGGIKPDLTAAERQQEYDRGLTALARAPAGEMLMGLAWREQFSGRPQVSGTLFQAAQEFFPGDAAVARLASLRQRAGRPPLEVAGKIRELITLYPDYSINYHNLGYALANGGDRAAGIAAIREHVARTPNHPNAHETLAELLLRDGKNDEAIQHAQRTIALDSAFTSGWAILADIKFNAGDLAGARTLWNRALSFALIPRDTVDMMNSLALSYLAQKDSRTTMAQLGTAAAQAEARRIPGQAATLHQEMAVVDALYGDGKGVPGHLAKAGQLGGANTAAQHFYTGLAYAASRQLDSARAASQRFGAVATDANRPLQRTLNGFIALQAGDPAKAASELAEAGPTDVLGRELLAEAKLKQGQAAEAASIRQSVSTSATLFSGGRTLDFPIVIAKLRAKSS